MFRLALIVPPSLYDTMSMVLPMLRVPLSLEEGSFRVSGEGKKKQNKTNTKHKIKSILTRKEKAKKLCDGVVVRKLSVFETITERAKFIV